MTSSDDGAVCSKSWLTKARENLGSGITVALVSIPLSTALALASGGTPIMGLQSAIYGPAVGGLLGGSNYNILGPAGALVNILERYTAEYGQEIIPLLALFSGLLIMLVYYWKLERFCTVIPLSVLEGFSFGVAITIGVGQFNNALGLKGLKRHPEFYMNVLETVENVEDTKGVELTVFFIFFVTLFSLMKFLPGRPWIIPVALSGILYGGISYKWYPEGKPTLLEDLYPDMLKGASIVHFKYWNNDIPWSAVAFGSLEVAFVAVLETLISARIADKLTWTRFDAQKEVFGLSLANMITGALGGAPCTGVLVRTSVNIASGATDKVSQFINAMVVLSVVVVLLPVFTFIPMPVIAAILIVSSIRLIPSKMMAYFYEVDPFDLGVLLFTTFVCVFMDGALGLIAGSFIAMLRNAVNTTHGLVHFTSSEINGRSCLKAEVEGNLNFINAQDVEVHIISQVNTEQPSYLLINAQQLGQIDGDGLESLKNIFRLQDKVKMALVLQENSTDLIERSSWYRSNPALFHSSEEAALEYLEATPLCEVEAEGGSMVGEEDDGFRRIV